MANFNKAKKYHFIYKTTCLVNDKYYIGMHSTNALNDGYIGSGKRLHWSINKHGIENFKCEILEFLPDRDSLANREKEIVNEHLLKDHMCLNLKPGGRGGFSSEEHRSSFINTGKLNLINSKAKALANANKAKLTKKYKENMSRSLTEYFKTHCGTFTGMTHSAETKQKISSSKKGNGIGSSNSQYGTCWITNGNENKKIKKEELKTFINLGWKLGRTY
jgi:hypothetical protein